VIEHALEALHLFGFLFAFQLGIDDRELNLEIAVGKGGVFRLGLHRFLEYGDGLLFQGIGGLDVVLGGAVIGEAEVGAGDVPGDFDFVGLLLGEVDELGNADFDFGFTGRAAGERSR
jgi:hypothetical protein